ncbi:glycosyl hydrolase family 18 protein [Chitinophaga deserti]|uniref:glycosyl hydrolase family 18 protein n=1 Tax=Chitinophaga deserti TaxID=2164099 RepID=UPI000D6A970A|nr:glycosyl hydrolase family 18 protein [Chitinophaga deserti]
MKMTKLLLFGALIPLLACSKPSPDKAKPDKAPPASRMRVQAYLFSWNGNWETPVSTADMAKVSDLTLAFFNPEANGDLGPDRAALKRAVDAARTKNSAIRIYFAIGGGSPSAHLEHLIKPANRNAFIAKIVQLATDPGYGFEGVDVDLENDLINVDYAGFVSALGTALHANKKVMTAALARWTTQQNIADSTLKQFDYINIMSYDETGYWNPAVPGQHSSVAKAVNDFQYFKSRGVPAGKLLIGLPFYGYGFGSGFPATEASARTYSQIVLTYPGAAGRDSTIVSGAGTIWYNGQPTITGKVQFAASEKAAGVMIWELNQDLPSTDERSLLRTIQQAIP